MFEVTSLPFPCSYFFMDVFAIHLLNPFLDLLIVSKSVLKELSSTLTVYLSRQTIAICL